MQKLDIIKVLKIREVKVCSFRRGYFDLNVKFSHSTEGPFIALDILKPEFKQMISESFESKISLLMNIKL